jgi:hypothetical protein
MSESIFRHHVHPGTNHFADWIRDVFGLSDLADRLRSTTTKTNFGAILNSYFKQITR